MLASLLLAFFFPALALSGLSPGRCSVENQACEAHKDNVILTIGGIGLKECEALCSDTSSCKFITFFGPESYPLYDYCFLLNDCSTQVDCNNCVSEVEVCFETCSSNLQGPLGEENILDIKFDIESENQCKLLCSENPSCAVYTHFNSSALTFVNSCFLTSNLQEPTHPCDNCNTGYPDCDSQPTTTTTPTTTAITTTATTTTPKVECGFTIDNSPTVHQAYMFTETSKTNVTVSAPRHCKLSIVAVGGGGGPGSDFGGYGGGGSGYVEWHEIQILGGTNYFRVKVGAGGKRGKNGKDTTIDWGLTAAFYRAMGGQKGDGVEGGDSYSGGGGAWGDQYGNGGSDGADGCMRFCKW